MDSLRSSRDGIRSYAYQCKYYSLSITRLPRHIFPPERTTRRDGGGGGGPMSANRARHCPIAVHSYGGVRCTYVPYVRMQYVYVYIMCASDERVCVCVCGGNLRSENGRRVSCVCDVIKLRLGESAGIDKGGNDKYITCVVPKIPMLRRRR